MYRILDKNAPLSWIIPLMSHRRVVMTRMFPNRKLVYPHLIMQ